MVAVEQASTGGAGAGGQEQTPAARKVRLGPRSSAWEHFTHFTAGDGKRKARCKKCNRVLAAETKNGTTRLLRHAENCKKRADPAVPPSCARSHTEEHESNPPQSCPLSVPQTDPPPPLHSNDPALPFPRPPSQSDEELPDREHGLELEDDEEVSNLIAQLTIALHGYDPALMSHSQPDEHESNPPQPSASFFNDLPPTIPPAAALAQPSIDPPPPVPQTVPYDPPPQPPLPCPPSSHSDDEVLPDHEQGLDDLQDDEESSNPLARLIVFHGFDPALVDGGCFRSFVGSLNPDFKFPSRLAVEKMCDGLFDEAREDLLSKLRRSPGKVSLVVDTTRTIHGEVLYTACHFIDDEWTLHKMVLDAFLVAPFPFFYGPLLGVPEVTAYNSSYHALDAHNILQGIFDYDIRDRLLFMAWAMGNKGPEMRQFLMQFISADFGWDYPIDIVLLQTAAELAFLLNPRFKVDMYRKVHGLGLTREMRQLLFSDIGLDHIRAYDPHWYSCYCSLELLRRHGSCTIADRDYSQLIELLCNIWGRIHRAIQRISASTYPTSNESLVEVFNVRELLESERQRTDRDNSIVYKGSSVFKNGSSVAHVLTKVKDTLDRCIEHSYLIWSVPLVLDPRYKLTYIKFIFSRAFGSKGARYISEVTRNIKKLYADYVQYDGADSDVVIETAAAAGIGADPFGQVSEDELNRSMEDLHIRGTAACRTDPLGQPWDKYCHSRDGRTDDGSLFDAEKELDRYLKDPRETPMEGFDILNWWKVNSWRYPKVARMARDALAMATCSQLSSEQLVHVSSIVRGYSKKKYTHAQYEV